MKLFVKERCYRQLGIPLTDSAKPSAPKSGTKAASAKKKGAAKARKPK